MSSSSATVVVAGTSTRKPITKVFSDPGLPDQASLRSKNMRKSSEDISSSNPVVDSRRHSWGGPTSRENRGSIFGKIDLPQRRKSLQEMAEYIGQALNEKPELQSKMKKGALDFKPHKFDAFMYSAPTTRELIRGRVPVALPKAGIKHVSAQQVCHESKDFYLVLITFDDKEWVGLRAKSNDDDKNKNFLFVNVATRLEKLEETFDEPWETFGTPGGGEGIVRPRRRSSADVQKKVEEDENKPTKKCPNLSKGSVFLISNIRTKEVWACAELPEEVDWELEDELPPNFPWLDIPIDCESLHPGRARASISVNKEDPAILKSYEELFKQSSRKKFEI